MEPSEEKSFLQEAGQLISGTFLAQVINLLFSFLFARIFSPDEFGEFGLFLAVLFVLGEVVNLKMDTAIMLAEDDAEAVRVFRLASKTGVIFTVLVCIVLLGIKLTDYFNLQPGIYFLPLGLLFTSYFQCFTSLLTKLNKTDKVRNSRIILSLFNCLLVVVVYYTFKQSSLIFGYIGGFILAVFYMAYQLKDIERGDTPDAGQIFRKFSQFPKYGALSSVLNNFSRQLPVFIFKMVYPLAMVGNFTFTTRLFQAPVGIITGGVGQIFYKKAANAENSGDSYQLLKLFVQTITWLFLLGIIPTLVFVFFGKPIFSLFFGAKWAEAGAMSSILAPWFLMMFITAPVSMLLDVKKQLKWEMGYNALLLLFRFVILWYYVHHAPILSSVAAFSILSVIFYLILLLKVYNLSLPRD